MEHQKGAGVFLLCMNEEEIPKQAVKQYLSGFSQLCPELAQMANGM